MPRRRTVTAERTTTVTERVTATETTGDVLAVAPGWDTRSVLTPHDWREQRAGQVDRCLDFLSLWAVSSDAPAEPPGSLVRDAVTILRAGPSATPLELTLGRSI